MNNPPHAETTDASTGLYGTPVTVPSRPLPLRQMGIGELIDGAFKLYRRDWLALIGMTAVVLVPVSIVEVWVTQSVASAPATTVAELEALTGQLLQLALVSFAIQLLLVQPFLVAAVTRAAADAYLGEPVSLARTFRYALTKLPAILWITIITTVLTLVGLILLIVPGIIAAIRLTLAPAILVVEDVRGTSAVSRSWNLTARHAWRVFGTLIVAGLISTVGAAIITIPTQLIATPMGSDGVAISMIGQVIATILTTPFSILIIVLLYFDLRVRKEGYDIEVMAKELATSAPST